MAEWIMLVLISIGLIFTALTLSRNQRRYENGEKEKRSELITTLGNKMDNVKTTLEKQTTELGKLSQDVNDFKTYCAQVSTAIAGRVTANEDKIKNLAEGKK